MHFDPVYGAKVVNEFVEYLNVYTRDELQERYQVQRQNKIRKLEEAIESKVVLAAEFRQQEIVELKEQSELRLLNFRISWSL